MKMSLLTIALSAWVFFSLGGCVTRYARVNAAASKSFSVVDPAPNFKRRGRVVDKMGLEEAQRKELENKFADTLDFCQPILSGYEQQSTHQAKIALGLALTGLAAGSVAIPALIAASPTGNAVLIAGLGGLAGATNLAQQTIQNATLSGSDAATTRNRIISSVLEEVKVATDENKDFGTRADAIMRVHSDCVLYMIAVPQITKTEAKNNST